MEVSSTWHQEQYTLAGTLLVLDVFDCIYLKLHSSGFMIEGGVMFCAVISPVQFSTCLVVSELALGFSAYEPVEAVVHCLQISWNDGVIHHTCSGRFFCLEGVFWLWPFHFL